MNFNELVVAQTTIFLDYVGLVFHGKSTYELSAPFNLFIFQDSHTQENNIFL